MTNLFKRIKGSQFMINQRRESIIIAPRGRDSIVVTTVKGSLEETFAYANVGEFEKATGYTFVGLEPNALPLLTESYENLLSTLLNAQFIIEQQRLDKSELFLTQENTPQAILSALDKFNASISYTNRNGKTIKLSLSIIEQGANKPIIVAFEKYAQNRRVVQKTILGTLNQLPYMLAEAQDSVVKYMESQPQPSQTEIKKSHQNGSFISQ